MATALTEFVPLVQPYVPGCPRSVQVNKLRDACIRFCSETWIIRETLEPIDVVSGTQFYGLNSAVDDIVVGLVAFLYNERYLDRKTEEELDIIDNGWRTADPGTPTYVTCPTPRAVTLNREPDESITDGIIARVATRPKDDSSSVDDLLYTDWRQAIRYGALQLIKEIPDKTWSDAAGAQTFGNHFNYWIQQAKAQAVKGNLKTSTRARRRSWV